MTIGLVEAAEAALAARRGGPEVAVVVVVPDGEETPSPDTAGPTTGSRVLVFVDGERRGSLGSPALDQETARLGAAVLREARPRRATFEDVPGVALLAEPHQAQPTLLIVGAGHIAVPLARMGAEVGFEVVVLDDREAFATPERFPDARVRRVDFAAPFQDVHIDRHTHVVLVTRAHRYDYDCLRAIMEHDAEPAYIGMVGSRRRVRATFASLLDAGAPRDRLARVHSPIGLDIGAETPEEIAVSIIAELVAFRRQQGPPRLDRDEATGRPGDVGEQRHPASLSAKEQVLERLLPEHGDARETTPAAEGRREPEPAPQAAEAGSAADAGNERRSAVGDPQSSDPDAVVFTALLEAAARGRPAVLATVVSATGSTPRGVGSRMLIEPGRGLVGTIGGGCGEGEVIVAAGEVAETGLPTVVRVELTDDMDSWSAAVCGGIFDVLLERVEGARPAAPP